jgi:multidrug efflux pump subunit AcrB
LIATITIPREEEPQIKVPMVDIRVAAPGLSAADSVELAGKPLEQIVKSIDGVEHVYTQAQTWRDGDGPLQRGPGPEAAATRVDEKIKANIDKIPAGVQPPQITVRGISDVPIVVLTLTPKGPGWDERSLYTLAGKLRTGWPRWMMWA